MSKPNVAPPDGERLAIDYLEQQMSNRGESVTVRAGPPSDWTPADGAILQVELDGTPTVSWPVLWVSTLRVTAWSESTTEAKRLARLAESELLAHPGATGWSGCRPGTGVFPARDDATDAALASITVRQKLRGLPV